MTDSRSLGVRIESDQDLLQHLHMTADWAGRMLGLRLPELGPDAAPCTDSFRLEGIHTLVTAARLRDQTIDADAIRDYVDRTRSNRPDQHQYDRLVQLLTNEPTQLELTGDESLVFVLPNNAHAYAENLEAFYAQSRLHIASLRDQSKAYIFATTEGYGHHFAEKLGLDKSRCSPCSVVSHMRALLVVYTNGIPKSYIYVARNCFVSAPHEYSSYFTECELPMVA